MSVKEKYEIFSELFYKNPFDTYDALRNESPFYKVSLSNGKTGWLVTRYSDCKHILQDTETFTKDERRVSPEKSNQPVTLLDYLNSDMLTRDGKEHLSLKKIPAKLFTVRKISELEELVRERSASLIEELKSKERFDLTDYAYSLTFKIIQTIMGFSEGDMTYLFETFTSLTNSSSNIGSAHESMSQNPKLPGLISFIKNLCEEKRKNPADDLTSYFMTNEEAKKLSEPELVSMVVLFIVAGYETTANLICNSIIALLDNPMQLDLLRNDHTLIDRALEEFLRFAGPVHISPRWATKDIQCGDVTIARGDRVLVSIIAANHDEEEFDDANEVNIMRYKNSHIAFGFGPHMCMGMHLGKLEAKVAIIDLITAFPNLKLGIKRDEIDWGKHFVFRGPAKLPVYTGCL